MKKTLPTAIAVLLAVFAGACGGASSETDEAADRQQIQTTLEAYLPLLGQAYSTGELSALEPYAAQKEVAGIHKRVQDLAIQGKRLEATFQSVTIEGDVKVWNYSNAYVTTHEVWDLVVYSTGSEQVLAEEYAQPNRVKYQLKRDGDSWRILYREKQE